MEKKKMKTKVIGITLAAIMLASVMAAFVTMGSAVSIGDNFNYIGAGVPTQTVLKGQNVQFNGTGHANNWADPGIVRVQKFDVGHWYDYRGPWSGGTAYNIDWDPALTLRATNGTVNTSLSVQTPNVPLKLKVGTKEVSSIAKGTRLIVDVGGINLFDEDVVKLVIMKGGSQIKIKDGQVFDPITVKNLTAWYGVGSAGIDTTNFDVGAYTFQIKTDPAKACGLDAQSVVKGLDIITGEIAIEAEKTFCVELQSVRLTVTGVPGDDIHVASSPLSPHVIFRAGVEDTPVDATNQFNDTIDSDGTRTYSVKFNDTGTFTIKVTVTSGPRYGEYDTVDITVSEKGVAFDVPSTVVIGEKVNIKGTANAGSYVDIFIDDVLYAKLDDLVIEADGTFSKEVTTTDVGMTTPGSVMLKAWIDITHNVPGDNPPPTTEDGSAVILVLETHLDASISKTTVSPGDSFEVYGNASSDYIELVILSPNGGNGTGMDGLYGTTIYTVPTFCNYTNYNFYKKIKVDSDADNGNYTIIVITPGRDKAYGTSEYSYISSILDLDGAGPELGAIDISNKTQEEIISTIKNVTVDQAGSDDLLQELYLTVLTSPPGPPNIVIMNETIEINASPKSIPADGVSTSTITIAVFFPKIEDYPGLGEIEGYENISGMPAGNTRMDVWTTLGKLTDAENVSNMDKEITVYTNDNGTVNVLLSGNEAGVANITARATAIEDIVNALLGNETTVYVVKNSTTVTFLAIPVFDTGESENPYPSIFGTHNGTIIPSHDINVSKLYTYPCSGTGGHTESIKIWNNSWNATATWHGYVGDWHNISFNESFTLEDGKEYNYTIITGSYPQIIHKQNHTTLEGSLIACTEFIDANGKRYNDWIPAIRLS